MTGIRQLEDRQRAWQSFHAIAGATRTLAAAQSLRWSEAARRAETHLARCIALHRAYPDTRSLEGAPRVVVLAVGTDLGLCGPLNRAIAEQLAVVVNEREPALVLVVGARLRMLVDDDVVYLSAPTSFARIEVLATEIEALLGPQSEEHLVLVLASGVDRDGRPQVSTWDEPHPPQDSGATRPVAELVDPEQTARASATLMRHARLVAALARAVTSEAEARWRTMNRAHDAAGRRIAEQQRTLDSQRQELVTQEMLEVRQGHGRRK